ncbi:hypothetical protein KILIM_001_00420 [Kineosphaera limosa NBRC 100340]|uniref:PKD domain-containing protein n=2 Tax=Kineosphaera TaxID=211469 RepID=K6W4F6_9MICO|nr:hypothetical protein KILIM_001_00420 [Kineosphaera limosa NBRC 100340]
MGGIMNGFTGAKHLRQALAVALGVALAVPSAGAVLASSAQAAPVAAAVAAQAAATPTTVTADALPTWQVNGVVWKQAVAGTTVYAVGSFTKTRPPGVAEGGAGEVDANNIVAFDITTGERVASFAPQLNGQALAVEVSPDKSTVYIGGDFTMVDGQARNHVAAFNAATGQLTSWSPSIDGQVRSLVTIGAQVYAGGNFRSASGQPRSRLAAFAADTGALRPWAPVVNDGFVWTMTATPDASALVVGGSFTQLGGTPQYGMGKIDASTGQVQPWAATSRIRTAGSNGAITSLRADGSQIYGAGYAFGNGAEFEGTFAADPATGAITWVNDCLGDTYDVYPFAGALYAVNHAHDCSVVGGVPDTEPRNRWQSAQASSLTATGMNTVKDQYGWDFTGLPNAGILAWTPSMAFGTVTSARQAAWTIVGSGDYLAFGGEFPRVNGVAQQGLTRYALPASAPRKSGPIYVPGSDPVATSTESGNVRVSFAALWDRDDARLTYDLFRDNTRVTTLADIESTYWNQPNLGFSDTGLTPGATHRYQVRATDSAGNMQWSARSAPVTVSGTPAPPMSPYERAVRVAGAAHLWRFAEASGSSVAQDAIGYADANASSVSFGVGGAITPASPAANFGAGSRLTTRGGEHSGDAVSVEAWVRTANNYNRGGRIVGFGDSPRGTSLIRDRVLYVDNNGRVNFSVMTDQRFTARSSARVNNGQWNHVVGTYADGQLTVYVNGAVSAQVQNVPAPRQYLGYWRLGADSINDFANRPSNQSIVGSVDEVAVYPTALPLARVQAHRQAGLGAAQNELPVAAFTSTVTGLGVSVDASGSSDPDGTIASYAWTFGDGATGTGANATHTYAAAGSYDVTLTVTDDKGATATKTTNVTVAAPPEPVDPVAAFTSTVTGLAVALDASGSSDPDGTITSYVWTFGDGATATGANATHTYAAAGSYDVTLTVTDNSGATATKTESVTVAAPSVFATDAFERTGNGNWGTADLGGAWSHTGPATRWSLSGSAGVATLGAGNGHYARLPIEQADSDATVTVSTDQAPSGGGQYFSVLGRYRPGAGDYRFVLRMTSAGAVTAALTKSVAGAESTVQSAVTTPITYAAGDTLVARFEITGSAPTTLRGKVWKKGEAEPADWTVTATDATADLATPGAFAVYPYISGSATNVPVAYAIDDVRVTPVSP